MPLFQRSVLDNYLKQLDAVRVALAHALLAQQDKTDKEIDAPVPAVWVDGGGDKGGGGEVNHNKRST